MLAFLEKTNSLSLWIRVVITSAAIGAAYFLQNPRRDRGTGRALSPLGRTTGFLVVAASRLLRPIAALIRQRSASVADPQAKSVLLAATEQMRVMARIHGRLCLGDGAVSFAAWSFLEGLCQDVRTSMASSSPISIECTAVSLILPVGAALPLGLIVNELITNAVKYAFPRGRKGTIRVSLSKFGTRLRLSVRDDGVGLRAPLQGTGLGFHLVQALAKEVGSKVDIKSRERGTFISMTFDIPPGTGRSREKSMGRRAYCGEGPRRERQCLMVIYVHCMVDLEFRDRP
jgi:two-component sensor histidine kinase